jgi:hypothetical protein
VAGRLRWYGGSQYSIDFTASADFGAKKVSLAKDAFVDTVYGIQKWLVPVSVCSPLPLHQPPVAM